MVTTTASHLKSDASLLLSVGHLHPGNMGALVANNNCTVIMHGHSNNPLSIAAQLFTTHVYQGEALRTWNGRQLEMSTTSTFWVYGCILKNVVFPLQNSRSCWRCCCCDFHSYWFAPLSGPLTWARTWSFRAPNLIWTTETFRKWTGEKHWQTSPFTSFTINYNSKLKCGRRQYWLLY